MADQATEGLLSPWLRKLRINAALPFVCGKTLDYGCGSGAFASLLDPNMYVGFDRDELSISQALQKFPHHNFLSNESSLNGHFDTVIALAVIEHVEKPDEFLKTLSSFLKSNGDGRIVITTPNPCLEFAHDFGAKIGLFSKHANEEHQVLLDKSKLQIEGSKANLDLVEYRRFILGANQIAVFKKSF